MAQLQERAHDLEMQLEDRERETMELRREHVNAERHEDGSSNHTTSRHVREPDRMRAENEHDQLLIQREDETEALANHVECLQLQTEAFSGVEKQKM